jgi:hypothetical protein
LEQLGINAAVPKDCILNQISQLLHLSAWYNSKPEETYQKQCLVTKTAKKVFNNGAHITEALASAASNKLVISGVCLSSLLSEQGLMSSHPIFKAKEKQPQSGNGIPSGAEQCRSAQTM